MAGARGVEGLGFTLLYPTFASLHARPIWVLYDLFVSPTARKGGVGRQLMNRARAHAVETGAASIVLSTARTNVIGQALYESLGYVQDKEFLNYELFLRSSSLSPCWPAPLSQALPRSRTASSSRFRKATPASWPFAWRTRAPTRWR